MLAAGLLRPEPHALVQGNATLLAVQNGALHFHIVLPETYSWCVYVLKAECPESGETQVTAKRNDIRYNSLKKVPAQTCFNDAIKLNDPGSAAECLDSDGDIVCKNPYPLVRAWYQPQKCDSSWTLDDPGDLIPRFTAITIAGVVLTLLGCGPLAAIWCSRGCPHDEYDSF